METEEGAPRWWRTSSRDLYPDWKGPGPSGDCVPGHGGWCSSHVPCATTRIQIERAIDLDGMRIKGTRTQRLSRLLRDPIQLWQKARSLWTDVKGFARSRMLQARAVFGGEGTERMRGR